MPRRASMSCQLNLRGLTARGSGALTSANMVPAGRSFFEIAMGGATYGTGTTIATTSTITVLNLTSASGFAEGGALVCATGPGGSLECREIKTIATNVVTLKLALSSIPALYAPRSLSQLARAGVRMRVASRGSTRGASSATARCHSTSVGASSRAQVTSARSRKRAFGSESPNTSRTSSTKNERASGLPSSSLTRQLR